MEAVLDWLVENLPDVAVVLFVIVRSLAWLVSKIKGKSNVTLDQALRPESAAMKNSKEVLYASQNNKERSKGQASLLSDSEEDQDSECSTESIERRNQVMKLNVYAVKDVLLGYTEMFSQISDAAALRLFKNSATAATPNGVNTNPEDKELWRLGTFDNETGGIVADKQYIAKAVDFTKLAEVKNANDQK